jgi:hypothetical protein
MFQHSAEAKGSSTKDINNNGRKNNGNQHHSDKHKNNKKGGGSNGNGDQYKKQRCNLNTEEQTAKSPLSNSLDIQGSNAHLPPMLNAVAHAAAAARRTTQPVNNDRQTQQEQQQQQAHGNTHKATLHSNTPMTFKDAAKLVGPATAPQQQTRGLQSQDFDGKFSPHKQQMPTRPPPSAGYKPVNASIAAHHSGSLEMHTGG